MKKNLILWLTAILLLTGCGGYRNGPDLSPEKSLNEEKTKEAPEEAPEGGPIEASALSGEIDSILDRILTPSMSEYEKVKAIHDYLVIQVTYDYENLRNGSLPDEAFTAEGALLEGSAVCQGYAEAFGLLCGGAGLESTMVYGTARTEDGEESHAWNQVRVNGLWYNIDVTWDDPLLNGETVTDGSNMIYDYFLVPDSVLEGNHFPDPSGQLQECTSSIYMEENRIRTISPYLEEPYSIVVSPEESEEAVNGYLSAGTLDFQIVYDTSPDASEEAMDLVMEQVQTAMEAYQIYGQADLTAQYGIADYTIIRVAITLQ